MSKKRKPQKRTLPDDASKETRLLNAAKNWALLDAYNVYAQAQKLADLLLHIPLQDSGRTHWNTLILAEKINHNLTFSEDDRKQFQQEYELQFLSTWQEFEDGKIDLDWIEAWLKQVGFAPELKIQR